MIHDAPSLTPESTRYWREAAAGRLVLPRCDDCGRWQWFPRETCAACGGRASWTQTSGEAELVTFAVEHRGPRGRWREQTPYVVAMVRLPEGITMLTTLADCDPAELECGDPLRVDFAPTTDPELQVPVFTPRKETAR